MAVEPLPYKDPSDAYVELMNNIADRAKRLDKLLYKPETLKLALGAAAVAAKNPTVSRRFWRLSHV